MPNKEIPIFYACDNNFIKYTVVSLYSMKQHAAPDRHYHIYVLHTNATKEMEGMVKALADERFTVTFEDVSDYLASIAKKLPLRDYYSKTTYFRLFIADMFPQYDKAIYIDSDTIVQGDIAELYDTDIGDSWAGACHEQAMVQDDIYGTYAERVVGISRHSFFNAGLMLINCRAFREFDVLGRFIEELSFYDFVVTQDEDYLNVICKDHVYWLDQRWNTEVEGEIPYPIEEAKIIHYIMFNKPWHYENCRFGDIYWRYAEKTSVFGMMKAELASYTDEQRERDRIGADNLHLLAVRETNREDNYLNKLNKERRAPDRVAVKKKIEEYEAAGRFTEDVEEDLPSRTLMPDEIDYFRRSPVARFKQWHAYRLARKFLNKILKEKMMIVKKIVGAEHFAALSCGAVITCNHFNAFDSFAMHMAYEASGHKKRKMYRVIREGNYTSFGGFYGYLMRNFYTLPLSSNRKTMQKFVEATDTLLREGNFVLIYPEQSMWWNYRKPKPLQRGAYRFAVKNGVPILPIFITMKDSTVKGDDGFFVQEYTIHISPPIYPETGLGYHDNVAKLMAENERVWREIYEKTYGMPLVYKTAVKEENVSAG